MADYVIKKHPGFTFAMEGADTVYTIPALADLSVQDVVNFDKVAKLNDVTKQCQECKAFILRYAPDLASESIGDMEFVQIFTAYAKSQAEMNNQVKPGES